jgi:hypothetical protein
MMDNAAAAAILFGPDPGPPPAAKSAASVLGSAGNDGNQTVDKSGAQPVTTAATPAQGAQGDKEKPPEKLPATALFEDIPPELVGIQWGEPVPSSTVDLNSVTDLPKDLTADEADVQAAKEAMVAAGAGVTQAAALWSMANENARAPCQLSDDETVAQLREWWGDKTDEKIAAARAEVAKATERWPGLPAYLEKTRLGNSPKFIRALAEKAARRRTILG